MIRCFRITPFEGKGVTLCHCHAEQLRLTTPALGRKTMFTKLSTLLLMVWICAAETTTEVMFRSASYPDLILTLKVHPADASNGSNIQKEPKMGQDHADLHLVGIKSRFGPIAETILGSPGRTVGYSFGDNCSATSCRPADQAYEIEAETCGEPGSIDRSHLT